LVDSRHRGAVPGYLMPLFAAERSRFPFQNLSSIPAGNSDRSISPFRKAGLY
jgi:hypothetical protein